MASIDKEVKAYFKTYYHQSNLMNIFLKDKNNLRIFSYENPTTKCSGSRKYFVSKLDNFLKWYLKTREEIRNFYEIITLETPCRLYFDIEYSKDFNPLANSSELFNDFSIFVKNALKTEYNIEININESFLILDSSTPTKFSLHIIIHLPEGQLFINNVEMKKFTDYLYLSMLEQDVCLIYNGKTNNMGEKIKVPIFDNCVYSKNRNFRLYLSCKLGKNVYLKLADWCEFYKCKNINNPTDDVIFYDSLCVPNFFDKYEVLPEYHIDENIIRNKVIKARNNGGGVLHNTCKISNNYFTFIKNGYGRTSMFPLLEEFIIEKNKEYVSSADIYSWDIVKLKSNDKIKLIFHIKGCRYCFNIRREHKSNKVYWEVYFDPNLICRQKCFDRECLGRASIGHQLPHNIVDEVVKGLTELGVYQSPFDSFADSFWDMKRDNVTLLEIEENKRRSMLNDKGNISNSFKCPKKIEDSNESPEQVQETSFNEEEDNFIVVDGKIPDQSTEYLNFIITTQQSKYNDSFEFSPSILSDSNNPLEFSLKQKSSFENTPKSSSIKTLDNKNSFSFLSIESSEFNNSFKSPQSKLNESKNFIINDKSNESLVHLESLNESEYDPLNECFINSTLSTINNSSILIKDPSLPLKNNQKNEFIINEYGEVEVVLESPACTIDDNSSINNIQTIEKNNETITNTEFEEIIDKPRESCFSEISKTLKEIQTIDDKYKSSEKCKSPFVSPVIKKKRRIMNLKHFK
uniref:DNA-directed primase/polymerase protein n=2 Tax=Strongyloides stercoralis TaxID=6248 RepID=A0A0K0EBH2_STRER